MYYAMCNVNLPNSAKVCCGCDVPDTVVMSAGNRISNEIVSDEIDSNIGQLYLQI